VRRVGGGIVFVWRVESGESVRRLGEVVVEASCRVSDGLLFDAGR
jgi:hypothetical protein